MPVETKLVNGVIRTVTAGTEDIEMTDKGNPRDGGGWPNTPNGWAKANRQAGYMNEGAVKKAKKKPIVTSPIPQRAGPQPKPRRSASPVQGPRTQSPM